MHIGMTTRLTRSGGDPPALALDLCQAALDSRLSFARASAGTDVINGTLTGFASDTPRLSPANGLLIEEARTNSARNSLMTGAVAGVVGSGGSLPSYWAVGQAAALTTEVLATGTRNGFTYLRLRISGTPDSTNYALLLESTTAVTAAQNDVWTASMYAAHVAGSLANISETRMRVDERNAGGSVLISSRTAFALNGSFSRGAHTRTLSNAGTARVSLSFELLLTAGQAIDATFEITAQQLELGAFATSYIPTSTVAATRAADICTMATTGWASQAEGTLYAEATAGGINPAAATSPRVVQLEGGNGNAHDLRRYPVDTVLRAATVTGSVSQANLASVAWPDFTTLKAVYAYRQNEIALATASTLQTDTSTPDGMPALTLLRLGATTSSSGFLNGWLRSVRYWSRRLGNDQIKAVTL